MKQIRVDKYAFDVKEHKGIKKITVHMPSTGAISGKQTISIYTTEEVNLNVKFTQINTFKGEVLTINTDYIIMVNNGKLVSVDDNCFYFLNDNEQYEVIPQGSYGTTRVDFTID